MDTSKRRARSRADGLSSKVGTLKSAIIPHWRSKRSRPEMTVSNFQLSALISCSNRRLRIDKSGVNDEPSRSRANVIKRIAGHESQFRPVARTQDCHIPRIRDLQLINNISFDLARLFHLDTISDLDVLQSAEEAVPMAGDPDVSDLPEERRAGDVAEPTVQS